MEPLSTGLLIVLMVASFYLLIIRPNRRRQAEQAKVAEALHPGTRVMLSSGIYGTVVEVGEKQATLEVAPGVRLTVLKQAVMQAITPGSQFAEDGPAAAAPGTTGELPTPEPADPRPHSDDDGAPGHPAEGEKR